MKDKKSKILLCTAQWLVALTGSIYGLVLAIFGYLSDWGPGGSMQGPFWKVFKASAFLVFVFLQSCNYILEPMSEIVEDKSAGMNGSFEIVKSGLPVNWLFYTPKTVPEGDFEMSKNWNFLDR